MFRPKGRGQPNLRIMAAHLPTIGHVCALATLLTMLVIPCFGEAAHASDAGERIRNALEALAGGKGDWQMLSVTYDDFHAFHGGLTLTIRGNGAVDQRSLRTEVGKTKTVATAGLANLVGLLLQQKAWEQQIPERQAIPDESQAKLIITYGGESSAIWEWYNDMGKIQRISKIRALMEQIAWKDASR